MKYLINTIFYFNLSWPNKLCLVNRKYLIVTTFYFKFSLHAGVVSTTYKKLVSAT